MEYQRRIKNPARQWIAAVALSTGLATQPNAALAENFPPPQVALVAATIAARQGYDSAPNDLKRSDIAREMERQWRRVAGAHIENWRGKILELGTNGDGNAFIGVEIAPQIEIKTYNNSFSDAGHRTLIGHATPLYAKLATLKIGDRVRFSATLIKPINLTERGRVYNTEILAQFADVGPE